MPNYLIAGNWKMHKTTEETVAFIRALHEKLAHMPEFSHGRTEVAVFPPFTSLYAARGVSPLVKTGAQNLFHEDSGAYTGEISPLMLKDIADYVIIGHSERREIFGETDETINRKVKTALRHGIPPILCIGETLAERENGDTFNKVERQLTRGLDGLTPEETDRLVIAYEPVWAIGTGKNASPDQAQEVHAFIRSRLKSRTRRFESVKILYGGSVKPENTLELLKKNDINGALIGGASLKVETFSDIIQLSVSVVP